MLLHSKLQGHRHTFHAFRTVRRSYEEPAFCWSSHGNTLRTVGHKCPSSREGDNATDS